MIGKSIEEQQLTRLLASTLVQKEVMEPMEKIGWSHASPPPPDYSGQPAKTEGAPASAPAPVTDPKSGLPAPVAPGGAQPVAPAKADTPAAQPPDIIAMFESLRDENGLIMGKYKTVPEALKGAGHLANMAKQAFQEKTEALTRLGALEAERLQPRTQPVASPAAAPVPVPASLAASRAELVQAQARLDGVLSSAEDAGDVVDLETLKKILAAQREVADLAIKVGVQEDQYARSSAETAERTRWEKVDEHMSAHYPDSLKHAAEIGLHIQSDPVLQEAVSALVASGKELQASILGWQAYQRSVLDGSAVTVQAAAVEKEEALAAKGQVRQELLEAARKDAGVIQGSAGGQGIHENGAASGATGAELSALTAQMRMEGDAPGSPAAVRFRHLIIGRHLDPSIFGSR